MAVKSFVLRRHELCREGRYPELIDVCSRSADGKLVVHDSVNIGLFEGLDKFDELNDLRFGAGELTIWLADEEPANLALDDMR